VQLRPLTAACVLLAATAALAAGCGGGGSGSSSGAATVAAVASTDFCPSVDALAASVASARKLDPKTATKEDFEAAAADLRKQAADMTVAFHDTTQVAAMNVQLAAKNLRLSRQGLPEGTTVAQGLYHLRPSLIYLQKALQSARASFHCSAS
jgi:hypothetical protein